MTPTKLATLTRTIHGNIAAVLPPLSHLECDDCHRRQDITTADAAGYLAHGWPECCGYTMRLVTAREAQESAKPTEE